MAKKRATNVNMAEEIRKVLSRKPDEAFVSVRETGPACCTAELPESEASEAKTEGGAGGDSGDEGDEESSGDDDDGEPPRPLVMSGGPEWWQTSLLIAFVITLAIAVLWWLLSKNRYFAATLLGSFLGVSGLCLYYNPEYWRRRMAAVCLSMFAGFNGLSIIASCGLFSFTIPPPDWSANLGLCGLAAWFTWLDYLDRKD